MACDNRIPDERPRGSYKNEHCGSGSSRGDGYQRVVALECAIEMLLDSSIQWLEIDLTSTNLVPNKHSEGP